MRAKVFFAAVFAVGWLFSAGSVYGAVRKAAPTVLFIPHDNRPISAEQTAEVVRKIGWEVLMPPAEVLGSREDTGDPERIFSWLEENAPRADRAVLSTDSLLYGSLVGSRKHGFSEEEVLARAERLAEFSKAHPRLKLYAFGSIMRSPRSGAASGTEEPSYYSQYGAAIFRYTALSDKAETDGLTRGEKKEFALLASFIPKAAIEDWLSRREKNFAASSRLIELTRDGAFSYLALGRDDNAPYSQTHKESRKLSAAGADLGITRFQTMAGIDEIALLMLTRAVNDELRHVPFVHVRYNWGRGERTVPAYSDEPIGRSVHDHILAAGGISVSSPKQADLVLLVNTHPAGKTFESNARRNDGIPHEGTAYFADMAAEAVFSGKRVAIADILYANGADNALMEALKERDLLFKIHAYAGWNTPTNSMGFVLGQGMLSPRMTNEDCDRLLLMRYLDDWAYQANVRPVIARQLGWLRISGAYMSLNEKRTAVEMRATRLMRRFAEENLPPFEELGGLDVTFPWNRMFEARFDLRMPVDRAADKAAGQAG